MDSVCSAHSLPLPSRYLGSGRWADGSDVRERLPDRPVLADGDPVHVGLDQMKVLRDCAGALLIFLGICLWVVFATIGAFATGVAIRLGWIMEWLLDVIEEKRR